MYDKQSTRVDGDYNFSCGVSNWRYYEVECVVCGDKFKSCKPSYLSKYCSARCANDAYIAWRREQVEKKRAASDKCVVCKISIRQTGAKIILYCSNRCKQKAYRERSAQKNIKKEGENHNAKTNS